MDDFYADLVGLFEDAPGEDQWPPTPATPAHLIGDTTVPMEVDTATTHTEVAGTATTTSITEARPTTSQGPDGCLTPPAMTATTTDTHTKPRVTVQCATGSFLRRAAGIRGSITRRAHTKPIRPVNWWPQVVQGTVRPKTDTVGTPAVTATTVTTSTATTTSTTAATTLPPTTPLLTTLTTAKPTDTTTRTTEPAGARKATKATTTRSHKAKTTGSPPTPPSIRRTAKLPKLADHDLPKVAGNSKREPRENNERRKKRKKPSMPLLEHWEDTPPLPDSTGSPSPNHQMPPNAGPPIKKPEIGNEAGTPGTPSDDCDPTGLLVSVSACLDPRRLPPTTRRSDLPVPIWRDLERLSIAPRTPPIRYPPQPYKPNPTAWPVSEWRRAAALPPPAMPGPEMTPGKNDTEKKTTPGTTQTQRAGGRPPPRETGEDEKPLNDGNPVSPWQRAPRALSPIRYRGKHQGTSMTWYMLPTGRRVEVPTCLIKTRQFMADRGHERWKLHFDRSGRLRRCQKKERKQEPQPQPDERQ